MEVTIVAVTIVGILIVEAIAFLAYKVFKMGNDIKQLVNNVEGLSHCMLEIAKRSNGMNVIETEDLNNSSDFDFPEV